MYRQQTHGVPSTFCSYRIVYVHKIPKHSEERSVLLEQRSEMSRETRMWADH